jgi:hypothetical protein
MKWYHYFLMIPPIGIIVWVIVSRGRTGCRYIDMDTTHGN